MIEESFKVNGVYIIKKIYNDKSIKYVSKVVSKITENENAIVLTGVINENKVNLIYGSSKSLNVDMNSLLKDSIKLVDGNGGGSKALAQGGGKNNSNLESLMDYAIMKLEKELV